MAELQRRPSNRGNHADKTYNWDNYEDDFRPTASYVAQEEVLSNFFKRIQPNPQRVLEVGPGLGRVTSLLTAYWPSASFALFDISEEAIKKASAANPEVVFESATGILQGAHNLRGKFPLTAGDKGFDLIVAVEVLMHIPPVEVSYAMINLRSALADNPESRLITCDWTQDLGPNRKIRVQNYRHDYAEQFDGLYMEVLDSAVVGFQTAFVTRRAPQP